MGSVHIDFLHRVDIDASQGPVLGFTRDEKHYRLMLKELGVDD